MRATTHGPWIRFEQESREAIVLNPDGTVVPGIGEEMSSVSVMICSARSCWKDLDARTADEEYVTRQEKEDQNGKRCWPWCFGILLLFFARSLGSKLAQCGVHEADYVM